MKNEKAPYKMGENIYKSLPDGSLVSRIYKGHLHLSDLKKPNLKTGKGFE